MREEGDKCLFYFISKIVGKLLLVAYTLDEVELERSMPRVNQDSSPSFFPLCDKWTSPPDHPYFKS